MGSLKVTGSQEKETILVLAANTSCARKYPSALHVPLSAENDKNVHGDEHREALCVGLLQFFLLWKNLCASLIVMIEPAQDREGENLPTCGIWWQWFRWWLRNLLLDALMRSGSVEVPHICVEHALELLLMHDEQMIEALTSHTAQEALTDGIGSRSSIRSFEHLDVTGLGHPIEGHPKLAIVITDEILRPLSIGGRFPKLLCSPSVSGTSCDSNVDHFA